MVRLVVAIGILCAVGAIAMSAARLPGPVDGGSAPARSSVIAGALPGAPAREAAPDERPAGTLDVTAFPPPTPGDANAPAGGPARIVEQGASEWPVAILQNPDARVRRQALEEWARNPQRSLDGVSAMMVDADETIRERAQQIFEGAIARR